MPFSPDYEERLHLLDIYRKLVASEHSYASVCLLYPFRCGSALFPVHSSGYNPVPNDIRHRPSVMDLNPHPRSLSSCVSTPSRVQTHLSQEVNLKLSPSTHTACLYVWM